MCAASWARRRQRIALAFRKMTASFLPHGFTHRHVPQSQVLDMLLLQAVDEIRSCPFVTANVLEQNVALRTTVRQGLGQSMVAATRTA